MIHHSTSLAKDQIAPVRWKWCALVAAIVGLSFALISFHSAASIDTIEAEENQFHLSENKAADQQREVTMNSAYGFLLLGGAGLAAMLAPAPLVGRLQGGLWWALLAYTLWVFASVAWAEDAQFTSRKLVIFGLFMAGALGFSRLLGLRDFAITMGAVGFAYIAVGVLAEMSIQSFTPWRSYYRFSGTVHPNEQGLFCAFAGLAAMFLRGRKPGWTTVLGLTVFLASFVFLILTKSRTGLAAVLAALALGAVLRTSRANRAMLLTCCAGLLGLALLTMGAAGSAAERDFGKVASLGRGEHVTSLTGRLPLWAELIKRASHRPWLGYGFSGFWTAENIEEVSDMFYWHIPSGHSVYIDQVLAVGIIGLALYLWMIFAGIRRALAAYRASEQPEYVFAVSVLLLALVHGFAESKFSGVGFSAFVTFGVLAALAWTPVAAQPVVSPESAPPTWATARSLFPPRGVAMNVTSGMALAVGLLVASSSVAAPPPNYDGGPGWLQISPKATFLRTSRDAGAIDSVFFLLAELPFSDVTKPLTITVYGDFATSTAGLESAPNTMYGVFTKTPTIRPATQQFRLVDALRSPGAAIAVTSPTYWDRLPTDIPEDFQLCRNFSLPPQSPIKGSYKIPTGAQYVLLRVGDNYLSDNSDRDNDLWVYFSRQ